MSSIETIFLRAAAKRNKLLTGRPSQPLIAESAVVPPVEMLVEPSPSSVRTATAPIDLAHLQRMRVLPPNPPGPQVAPYRMLRTQALRRMNELHANLLAVLSARANDGKTLTAINLAVSVACDISRTALLVDLDLRNPSVHRYFGVTPERGIEDHLQNGTPIEEVLLKPAGYERLTLLPATKRIEESADLLSGRRIFDLILELRSRYSNRLIVVDLPPVLEADDALAFAPHIPAAVFVVGEGRTRRGDVTRSLQMMKDTTFIGTVLNASREKAEYY